MSTENQERLSKCPFCGELVSLMNYKCSKCGEKFWVSEQALATYILTQSKKTQSNTESNSNMVGLSKQEGSISNLTPPFKVVNFPKLTKKRFTIWVAIFVFLVWYNWQTISGFVTVQTFDKNSSEYILGTESRMSSKGLSMYLINHPQVLSKASFRNLCNAAQVDELGCFVRGTKSIYIMNVPLELRGEMIITAAHEMLHAAYSEMGTRELEMVNSELDQEILKPNNFEIKKHIDTLGLTDEFSLHSELHSYIGTEADNLSPYLENHFSKYLYDRGFVVQSGQNADEKLKLKDNLINSEISLVRQYDATLKVYDNTISQQEKTLNYGYFSSYASYSSYYNVYSINFDKRRSLINTYNTLITKVNQEIDDYNYLITSLQSSKFSPYELGQPVQSK